MTDTGQKILSLSPDRLAFYGYVHVPWIAKRQVLIPSDALPGAEERLGLFEAAARMFLWDGYKEIGIDHFAREGDPLAAAKGRMRRNFQGDAEDGAEVLIGLGASAISRYPQGYAQNSSTSSAYAQAIRKHHRLATERGHVMSLDARLRADMIERVMCRFELDLNEISARHGVSPTELLRITATLRRRFADWIEVRDGGIRLVRPPPRLIARLAAQEIDAYAMPEGRHSRAL